MRKVVVNRHANRIGTGLRLFVAGKLAPAPIKERPRALLGLGEAENRQAVRLAMIVGRAEGFVMLSALFVAKASNPCPAVAALAIADETAL